MVAAMRGIAPKQPEDVSLDYLSHQNLTRTILGTTGTSQEFGIWIFVYGLWTSSTPLPSHPCFSKVHLHGQFLRRVSREGLGTSEM